MAGEFSPTNSVNNTRAATFIPEGDTLHIPKPTRGTASAKTTETQVVLQQSTESEVQVLINQHYEYSRFIEDITEVQALASLRKFYTADAGYALAKQVDTDLLKLGRGVKGGDGTIAYDKAVIGSDGSTLYTGTNEAALTDAAIRKVIQTLDDADVPMDGRVLVIPPVARNTLMGLARFTEQSFTGEASGANTIRNGQIGDVYGVKVYVSTNCETATGAARIALMFHKDAFVLAEQMGVRSQTQYKQEYLATLYTADMLYGVKELRDEAAVAIALVA